MADTRNGMTQRRIEINNGATAAVSAVEAAGRTRVVLDLFHTATYETQVEGNNLVLTVNNGVSGSATRYSRRSNGSDQGDRCARA